MNLADFVKELREYYEACLSKGWTPKESMEMTLSYQRDRLMIEMLEKQHREEGDEPWKRM